MILSAIGSITGVSCLQDIAKGSFGFTTCHWLFTENST
jgi:hypothetical protein